MVMPYERPLQSVLLKELSRPTLAIHALTGPRQVRGQGIPLDEFFSKDVHSWLV